MMNNAALDIIFTTRGIETDTDRDDVGVPRILPYTDDTCAIWM